MPKDTPNPAPSTAAHCQTSPASPWRKRQDVFFIFWLACCLISLIALYSYSPQDSAWSAVGQGEASNAAGAVGAYLADVLFHALGVLAYALPLLIGARLLLTFRLRVRETTATWRVRVPGLLLSIASLCTLAEMSVWQTPTLPAGPGGVLGASLLDALWPWLSFAGTAVVMLAALALGSMLFLSFSWLAVFDWIGGKVLALTIHRRPSSLTESANGINPDIEPVGNATASHQNKAPIRWPQRLFQHIFQQLRVWRATKQNSVATKRSAPVVSEPTIDGELNDAIIADFSADIDEHDISFTIEPPLLTAESLSDSSLARPESARSITSSPRQKATPQKSNMGTAGAPKPSNDGEKDAREIPIEPLEKRDAGMSERALREMQGKLFTSEQGLPSIALLDPPRENQGAGFSPERLQEMSHLLVQKLADFGVKIDVTAVAPGPVITRFEIQPAPGVKASKISGLARDLARSMAMVAVRVVEVIPGKSVMGIEVPNENRAMVALSEVLSSQEFDDSKSPLTMALGHDIGGNPIITDLAKMPHLLVAGTTGSGKSVGVNAMIISLLFKSTPEQLRLILVDPKMLELSVYEGIPHLLTPVITDMKEAHNGLRWSVEEMERRYQLMAAMGVRNIAGYNKKVQDAIDTGQPIMDPIWQIDQSFDTTPPILVPLPYIVIVIDEFADMMMMVGKKVEELIARIAQKARAAGIHMILATQRPSVDVITGLIKANVPTRIAFQVSSKIDSRTILDQGGAEQLLGHGDMLFMPPGNALPERIHGAFVDDDEVHRVVAEWKLRGEPEYIEAITQAADDSSLMPEGGDEKDELYDQAVAFITESGKCSISSVQRKLRIGYNRAARLVETMEACGVVSPPAHNGSREILARAAP